MSLGNQIYAFAFKGSLAQAAVSRESKTEKRDTASLRSKIQDAMPMDLLSSDVLAPASGMAIVYTAIAAFENSARKFIQDRLMEEVGADWWQKCVSGSIRQSAEKRKSDEEDHRYHGARGTSMIYYTQMKDLPSIIQNNDSTFEGYIPSPEWAKQIFRSVERSRNVIMHAGELSLNDIQRVAMNIRDWVRQVGG